ncbi:MAG: hypothetical protein KA170_11760 [Candidatus Promineofilum sp.]|nr:hypothetical protein [Promineifilum sp.]
MNAKWIRQLAATLAAATAFTACAQTPAAKEDPKTRLAKAEAMFAERCKKSGEFIHRTAENVEGIFLMKIRPDETNFDQQYRMDDPYGHDVGGKGLINSFLQGRNQNGSLAFEALVSKGYRYVEGGCKNFCVNGQLAGNCRIARSDDDRSEERCTQGVAGQPIG